MIIEKIRQASACVKGKDHEKKGVVCQDKTFYNKSNGIHAIVLSDGAGSRKFSHIGAEIVTKTIGEYITQNFTKLFVLSERRGKKADEIIDDIDKLKNEILYVVNKELEQYVKTTSGVTIDDLSCTLLFVALNGDKYLAGHIGDGVIGIIKNEMGNEILKVLSHPENGDSPNITFFINDNDALSHLRIYSGEVENLKGFILMSDGPEESLYDKNNGLNDNALILFEGFKGNIKSEYESFLENIVSKKIAEISYDDLSINLLYKETINTNTKNDAKFLEEILNGVSENQVIQISNYSVLVDDSINSNGKEHTSNEWLQLLKRRYD